MGKKAKPEVVAELLPCPFCGHKPEMVEDRTWIQPELFYSMTIICRNCGTDKSAGYGTDRFDQKRKAEAVHDVTKAWNRRVK